MKERKKDRGTRKTPGVGGGEGKNRVEKEKKRRIKEGMRVISARVESDARTCARRNTYEITG